MHFLAAIALSVATSSSASSGGGWKLNGSQGIVNLVAERLSPSKEFIWIRNNQRLVAKRLKDPDSAQFSNDYVSYKIGAPVACGTVNAKNSFGGYAGSQRYIGAGTLGVFLSSDVSDFDSLWRKLC